MRKLCCFILSVSMLLSMCGCSGLGVIRSIMNGNNEVPEFALGKVENQTYTNEFLGISCTLPQDWEFYSEEQILELNNVVGEYLDEDVAKQLENAAIVYDMCAVCPTNNNSVNITMERLTAAQDTDLDMKKILEAQFDSIKSTYQNMGYTDVDVKYQKVMVNSREFDGIAISAKIQGVDFFGRAFAFQKANYLVNVTVCTLDTNQTTAIINCFTVT